jgi:hypothetical protein
MFNSFNKHNQDKENNKTENKHQKNKLIDLMIDYPIRYNEEEIGSVLSDEESFDYTSEELIDFENQRTQAIWDQETWYNKRLFEDKVEDRLQQRDNKDNNLSEYEKVNNYFKLLGDLSINRYWFWQSPYTINDLYDKTFSLPNILIKEDYYYQGKDSYKSITKNLTPNCTEREIGKVFFLWQPSTLSKKVWYYETSNKC